MDPLAGSRLRFPSLSPNRTGHWPRRPKRVDWWSASVFHAAESKADNVRFSDVAPMKTQGMRASENTSGRFRDGFACATTLYFNAQKRRGIPKIAAAHICRLLRETVQQDQFPANQHYRHPVHPESFNCGSPGVRSAANSPSDSEGEMV